jgi:tRNA threonylcarbamoyladenosine biosynthesis protein TsaE
MEQYFSHSVEQTFAIGYRFGKQIIQPAVICFFGELAAGKTAFIKGFVESAANIDSSLVHSPTFTYLHVYEGEKIIYHFDLYRLRNIDEFISMGFDEYFFMEGICCVEWSERIADYLPEKYISVFIQHIQQDQRSITITRNTR